MKFLRRLLFPFAILYNIVTFVRNFLYDNNILKSYEFDIPIICVGNLNVGGTGKTPQIEYLIRLLLDNYKVATLSRGYKRSTSGFILADNDATAKTIGDEPFQFFNKFKNIQVTVDADRKNGIENLLNQEIKPEIILLDDAFQHRRVKAGFYVLLTKYNDLYSNDYLLPTGNLRESRNGANRANAIIVTKCPENITENEQNKIKLKLKSNCPIFFSTIVYDDFVYAENEKIKISEVQHKTKLIVAGIANPDLFFDFIKNKNDETITFADHHNFTENDLKTIKEKATDNLIITTEKDFVRLKDFGIKNLYYLPIKSKIINNLEQFDDLILNFIANNH